MGGKSINRLEFLSLITQILWEIIQTSIGSITWMLTSLGLRVCFMDFEISFFMSSAFVHLFLGSHTGYEIH